LTHNQIEFWKLNESRRSNYANELIKQAQNEENRRSNIANEEIQRVRNAETERANRAQEELRRLDQQLQQNIAQLQASTSRYSTDVSARLKSQELGIRQGELEVSQAKVANETKQTALKSYQWSYQQRVTSQIDLAKARLMNKELEWYDANQVIGALGSVAKGLSAAMPLLLA